MEKLYSGIDMDNNVVTGKLIINDDGAYIIDTGFNLKPIVWPDSVKEIII